ncbi:MAG: ABC transporter ATP-binding protein [Dehalococcoidia bacterium]
MKNNHLLCKSITKRFGNNKVISNLDLSLKSGDVALLLGKNGAGKSTLIKLLSFLSLPDSGEITINDINYHKNDSENYRRQVGSALHENMLYNDLTVKENLFFFSKLYFIQNPEKNLENLIKNLSLSEYIDKKIRFLSHGIRKKVSIAKALLHNPNFIFFDEIESGLDKNSTNELEDLILEKKQSGAGILLTSHMIRQSINISNKVVIMNKGNISKIFSNVSSKNHKEIINYYEKITSQI